MQIYWSRLQIYWKIKDYPFTEGINRTCPGSLFGGALQQPQTACIGLVQTGTAGWQPRLSWGCSKSLKVWAGLLGLDFPLGDISSTILAVWMAGASWLGLLPSLKLSSVSGWPIPGLEHSRVGAQGCSRVLPPGVVSCHQQPSGHCQSFPIFSFINVTPSRPQKWSCLGLQNLHRGKAMMFIIIKWGWKRGLIFPGV